MGNRAEKRLRNASRARANRKLKNSPGPVAMGWCHLSVRLLSSQDFPGDLVTSLRETGEKILLPYPIREPARSEFAFEWWRSLPVCWCFSELFCLVLYRAWNSELCSTYEKCWFGQLGSLFRRWIFSTLGWKRFEYFNRTTCSAGRIAIVSLKITWCFTSICF